MTIKPLSCRTNIVVQKLEREVLIYDLSINKAFCLNETSALVYNLADGTKTPAEISDAISIKSKTKVSQDFVWFALNELEKNNLLENAAKLPDYFAGLSRREVIKKIGLASMVMIPVISSLVAPTAAMAQSGGIALFGACPAGSGCASGLSCKSCQGGSCGPGANNRCCTSASGNPSSGNGQALLCVANQNTCDNNAGQCCSGKATASPNFACNASGNGTPFICSCSS